MILLLQEEQNLQKQAEPSQGKDTTLRVVVLQEPWADSTQAHMYCVGIFFCLQHLLDVKSLRYLSSVTLHDRITKSLLHLHKKKKPPSISAQFQVSDVVALCWKTREFKTMLET